MVRKSRVVDRLNEPTCGDVTFHALCLPFVGDRGAAVRVLLYRVYLGVRSDAQGSVVQEAE